MLAFGAMGAGPTATITVDGKTITDGYITVNRGETVCFDGTSSTDADGVNYEIVNVNHSEEMFLQFKHCRDLIVKPFKNERNIK